MPGGPSGPPASDGSAAIPDPILTRPPLSSEGADSSRGRRPTTQSDPAVVKGINLPGIDERWRSSEYRWI